MNFIGFFSALLAAFFSAFVYLIIELIGKKEHPLVIINYFMMTSFFVGIIGIYFYWKPLKKGFIFFNSFRDSWFFWSVLYDESISKWNGIQNCSF